MDQPIIEQDRTHPPPIEENKIDEQIKLDPQVKIQEEVKIQPQMTEEQMQAQIQRKRMEIENLLNLPPEMQQQQNNLVYRERKTRWGERQIKRSKIQQDAVFNPLEALYHGKTLLPITQYGQAELQIKMSLYSEGKRRKSKWHHEIQKTFNPPVLNYISPNISIDEIEYLLRLYRLDELASQMNNYVPEDPDLRSPSPQPIYDNQGKRINTRQVRKRDSFLRERISLIQDCMRMRKTFVPPEDYRPLKKFKKIYLTENAINDSKANYIGKIIGPKGQTQKLIQQRSNCKIAVRGRGANKTQKDIFQNYEPLHIIIVADNDDDLQKGVDEIQKILNGEEDQQLKDLIDGYNLAVKGIYDNYCQNCQQEGHRTWGCPFQSKNQVSIKCSICGQSSHPTSDCPQKQAYLKKQQNDQIAMLIQSQYSQFKQELNNKKPKGGAAFITDYEPKSLLAITHSQPGTQSSQKAGSASIALGQSKPIALAPAIEEEPSDLPKFQDD